MAGSRYLDHTTMLSAITKSPDSLTMFSVRGLIIFFMARHMSLRASIGLAHWQASTPGSPPFLDQSGDDAAHLLAAADQDMYRDKRQRARHLVLVRSTERVTATPALLPALETTGTTRAVITDDAPRLFGGLVGLAES